MIYYLEDVFPSNLRKHVSCKCQESPSVVFWKSDVKCVRHCASLDPGTQGWILAVMEEQTVTHFYLNYLLYSLKPLLKG